MAVIFMLIKKRGWCGKQSDLDVVSHNCKADFFPSFHGLITVVLFVC